ncbi:hypothetical protein [Demequina sp. SO4-18]|uniref:hypothetical protein n=1 Tax=Demequina sp. SO4-18 TaxID=3401026 RepID=UPI003B5AF633
MNTTTNTPDVEAAERDLANADQTLTTVRDGIADGTIDDPAELEAAESRRKFAFMRRKGATERAEKAAQDARRDALAALATQAAKVAPTPAINTAYAEFEAEVAKAVEKFATKATTARESVNDVMSQAHHLGLPNTRDEAENGFFIFGDQLHYPQDGGSRYVTVPYPVDHTNTRHLLEKSAAEAIRVATRRGGTR